MGDTRRQYRIKLTDKTLRAFFGNTSLCSCIMGPIGGAKTSACLQRFPYFAMRQKPHPIDNVRRTRWISVRDTYRDMERTTLKTWHHWWPKEAGDWRGGANGEPGQHTIEWPMPDGTTVRMEVLFPAVGETDIEKFAGGFEITGFHIAESDKHPEELYRKLLERCGRFPARDAAVGFEGATYYGGWLDCNAPNYGNHIEKNFVTKVPEGWAPLFRQPGGLDADAENLDNLIGGRQYYIRLARSMPEWQKRRMIDNLFGFDRSGKPVYKNYNPFKHYSRMPLQPLKGRRLVCGLDQGWNAAASWQQRSGEGQLRILRELVCLNTPPEEFARNLKQQWEEEFPEFEPVFVADPAAFNPSDNSRSKDDVWALIVQSVLGWPIIPASTNARSAREASLHAAMLTGISGDTERLIIDPSCSLTHEGFNQMFRYKKLLTGNDGTEKFSSEIEKNDHSHVCEAAEYASMTLVGLGEIIGGRRVQQQADETAENWVPAGFG